MIGSSHGICWALKVPLEDSLPDVVNIRLKLVRILLSLSICGNILLIYVLSSLVFV